MTLEISKQCQKRRKRNRNIPFGVFYDCRCSNHESNLCLYNALTELCDFYEISVGDFVLSGGEIGAFVIIDTIVRLIPGVLGNSDSLTEETFERNLLEYAQYTKPKKWEKKDVPDVLLTGDHAKIKGWRLTQSEDITRRRRSDLWEKYKKEK